MDNRNIARLFHETADLLEVSAADPFRIRSYRRAAEALEQTSVVVASIAGQPKELLAIPGIGKGMAANIAEIASTGKLSLREELLAKYRPTMLELLKLPGIGPKTVALIWDALQICEIDALEAAAKAGHLTALPRMGAKQVEKLLKSIDDYRKNTGRFRLSEADDAAERLTAYLLQLPGVERVTPAGSLRRGREVVGDLDLLVTGPACEEASVNATADYVAAFAGITDLIAKGKNKVSFRIRTGMQVDVRLLPESSFGAALQYFTGSKAHNVTLRQRALRMGFTLNEYALTRLEDANVTVPVANETQVYATLGLDWIPPELRENCGEIEAAANHMLPRLVEMSDIRGDVHVHTDATDGRHTIREMAEAAIALGYKYIAITDHSKNLAMTNGLDEARALEHIARIQAVNREMEGRIRIFTGIEVDILGDGTLDLSDDVLAQMDVVIGSVHSLFNQPREQMTERMLRAIENKYLRIVGHMTGRLLLRREGYELDVDAVVRRCGELGVAVEHNSSPERLDLRDVDLKRAKEHGCKIVINTDAHYIRDFDKMKYGLVQLRRAWLTPADVLNTREPDEFLAGLRAR
jgi:DNA polymerase (family 10)